MHKKRIYSNLAKLLFFFIISFLPFCAFSTVYVYEVITKDNTFNTASLLEPDTYLYYNGGKDIIFSLKILEVFDNKDIDKAFKKYELGNKNIKFLPHKKVDNKQKYRVLYWWR